MDKKNKSNKSIYLTDKEWESIQKKAEMYDCSISDVIRRLLQDSMFLNYLISDIKIANEYSKHRKMFSLYSRIDTLSPVESIEVLEYFKEFTRKYIEASNKFEEEVRLSEENK